MAFFLILVALMNYMVDAYYEYPASAMAAASCCRSIFGAVLPLAAAPMFHTLGMGWRCSLLGVLSVPMAFIPSCLFATVIRFSRGANFYNRLWEEVWLGADGATQQIY
jgi:hypothetical protein